MKDKGRIALIITVSLLLFVGIIFATAGIYFYNADSDFKKNAESTEATIEDIDISYSYDSDGERKKDFGDGKWILWISKAIFKKGLYCDSYSDFDMFGRCNSRCIHPIRGSTEDER